MRRTAWSPCVIAAATVFARLTGREVMRSAAYTQTMPWRILTFAFIGVAAITACFDRLTAPPCTPVSLGQASVNGDTITTTYGLRYIDTQIGNGATVAWCRNVAVHFDAFLLSGTKFDSTRNVGAPLVFAPGLGGLIDGFEQGVVGMRGGGIRRLIIPPSLGFGAEPRRDQAGQVIVPGNSTVVYDIEVVQVAQ